MRIFNLNRKSRIENVSLCKKTFLVSLFCLTVLGNQAISQNLVDNNRVGNIDDSDITLSGGPVLLNLLLYQPIPGGTIWK